MADDDVERSGAAAERAVQRQLDRLRRTVDKYGFGARVAAVIIGVVLVSVGAVLLIIPGPGWPLIIAGVAALAVAVQRLQRPVLWAAAFAGRMSGRARRSPVWAIAAGTFGLAMTTLLAYLLLRR
jgi:hypothetical protein